ncbi:tetratricopeptide repeat protein [Polynucleobacter paneuropaeus]|uniref:Tetratricopeptide repeat protein n=1 Tax=Polynucleobacter paneuropaeus TaxID=2527775 RepID=A0AAE2YL97_9BURK|nr:class I SAM-dependent methyltransferase [Polynucleobacter paneuropaeus]MBT8521732.1 tetratricopeptide repeat protein [Polynucleobacter paneuropaeus]MBT8539092.1 tetratricopeptide repeat protein [Polynucleobacter paneuropaeus]MBT8589147.1 tetratricopeptide repeat protein [Polynucleobacter paneuropaeus]MBT8591482.1 tetratricopeptide repeat protein [Polynucleobacter paneuropaeus]MBT8596872.1 tetratricopeptide repeat protein [Polynucleobacter paneuropaeus]
MHTQDSFQSDLLVLLGHYQNARYNDAYKLAISITEEHPNHPFAWKILGTLLQATGNAQAALFANETVVRLDPSDPEAFYNLSNTLKELGRLEDAALGYKKSIALKSDIPEAHLNLGVTLQELGKLQDAELSYKNTIALKPNYAEAFNNLANVLREQGRYEESVTQYRKAIKLKPKYPEAYNNLGIALQNQKQFVEAEQHYKSALLLGSDFARAHFNLGTLLQELARYTEAETSYRNAIALNPNYVDALYNLGITLLELGDPISALEMFAHLIQFKPTEEVKQLFVDTLKNIHPTLWDATLASMVTIALLEPWGKPHDIGPFACQLLKLEPDFQKTLLEFESRGDKDTNVFNLPRKNSPSFPLLHAILISGPIPDRQLEEYFTSLRFNFLKMATSHPIKRVFDEEEVVHSALAQQCFINEYIYYQTPQELELSNAARYRLTVALNEQAEVPAALLLSAACYFPLNIFSGCEVLLGEQYSIDVMAVLRQQIQESLEELDLRRDIPTLTGVDSKISLAVQNQYEENPYPRWVRLPNTSNSKHLNSFISKKYPSPNFSPLSNDENLEVLVAGCGTGEHSIACQQVIKGANILAVDLSMASLAYAKRKTIEMGITSIEYAQADLLKIASIGRVFDVIESVGVLHHLERPFEGWEALLSVLKPNGLMRLGFYSELAREDIAKVRNLISQDRIKSTPEEIRNYRHYLLGLKNIEHATSGVDFYSMSACRDLVFHVQEHRMRLDKIDQFLEKHQLKFLGFDIDRPSFKSYKINFPDDPFGLNLKNWHIFENENPHTFRLMYQFLVQKAV